MVTTPTRTAEQLLEALAAELEIPESRYDSAERSYKSIGDWLDRPASSLASIGTTFYAQGSFRLGTAIRPVSDEEHYDLDAVCEVNLAKADLSQRQLKELLGRELEAYAEAHNMERPEPARRCWTMNYADGAQFHMDVLPALPDGKRQRLLIEAATGVRPEWAELAIVITDVEHGGYRVRGGEWPASNPKGYAEWFRSRMRAVFEARRQALALEARAGVEDIPEYRVKTPLQKAAQILKRHRDLMFVDGPDDKPISVILTTLAALSYEQETTISGALYGILERMDGYIEDRHGTAWVANPTDPRENFADKWAAHPERREAFHDWLETARADFARAARLTDLGAIVDTLAPRMGRRLVETAARRSVGGFGGRVSLVVGSARSLLRRVIDAPHRRPPVWPQIFGNSAAIRTATALRPGFRPQDFSSNGPALPKRSRLIFEAETDVSRPYRVYWQVVNTGDEARDAEGLRGGFEEVTVESGKLTRRESTLYLGTHSIECFIVKNGYCVARSGLFIVNIQ